MRMRVFREVFVRLLRPIRGRARAHFFALGCCLVAAAPAIGQETLSYTYDARGRLVAVDHGTTGPNAGVAAIYTYDPADNRQNVAVGNVSAAPCAGVSFTIVSTGAVTEGVTSRFVIAKSGRTSVSCTVNFATADGTATSASDYVADSGKVIFGAAQTSAAISIATTDDSVAESSETFTVTLSAPTGGATLGSPATATATINDND